MLKVCLILFLFINWSIATADKIGGTASFDFSNGKLKIPCVKVKNASSSLNELFFDIEMDQINDDFTFELSFSEVEDPNLCMLIDSFARTEDTDLKDNQVSNENAQIEIDCEIRAERSKISVKGKNLVTGNYYATVTSGSNSVTSNLKLTVLDEVEFDFDSQPDDIASGDIAISSDFIDTQVSAILFDASKNEVINSSSTCLIK